MYRSTFSWPRHYLEMSGQLHAPAALPPGKNPGTHCIGGWVDSRAGLDDLKKWKFLTLPGLEPRPLRRPARSQSLYRLRYPDYYYYYYYGSTARGLALAAFSFSWSYTQSVGSLDGGSAHRKTATYTRNNTNTELTHTDIHALSWIRTHDPSVRARKDSSCLKPCGQCDGRIQCLPHRKHASSPLPPPIN
jgi:hypothetical protein